MCSCNHGNRYCLDWNPADTYGNIIYDYFCYLGKCGQDNPQIGGENMKRILLVDDSTDFLKILAQALERDFEVHTATGVSEAMAIIGEIEMDSICSDLEMKDVTGLDILASLRKNHIEIPFILMSGKDDCFEIKIAKCYGAVFISKTSSDFLTQIKNNCDRSN